MSGLAGLTSGVTIITGTDTDVGKTVATAVLARWLIRRRVEVAVCKPVQTGVGPADPGDLAQVGHLAGLATRQLHEFARLAEPLAPTTAARRAGVRLPSIGEVAERLGELAATNDAVLVEGAGGVLVGLDSAGNGLLELADALGGACFVVVCRAGLGTLNHTGLTCAAIQARGHQIRGLVVGAWPATVDLATECNQIELAMLAPILARLPAGIGHDPKAVRRIAKELT